MIEQNCCIKSFRNLEQGRRDAKKFEVNQAGNAEVSSNDRNEFCCRGSYNGVLHIRITSKKLLSFSFPLRMPREKYMRSQRKEESKITLRAFRTHEKVFKRHATVVKRA